MEIKKLDSPVSISDSALVRLKEMGNITEIMYSEKRSRGGYITKIDKDHYVDNRTGELFEFKHLENRAQDLANVAKSLAQGRDILFLSTLSLRRATAKVHKTVGHFCAYETNFMGIASSC